MSLARTTTSMTSSAPGGSATLPLQGSLLLDTLTIATCETSCQPISTDTDRSTSSPASASGRTLSGWLDGATIAPCGQSPARANLSARQAVAQGYLTIATSGPPHTGSSPSNVLARSLASRLQARTASLGSTLYRLTWKHSATPAGRWISRLRASVLRTSDSASTGWPTPTENDALKGGEITPRPGMICLVAAAQMARGWAAPKEPDHRPGHASRMLDTARINLNDQAMLAGWPTPRANDSPNISAKELALIMSGERSATSTGNSRLELTAAMAGWATPATRDYRTPNHKVYADRGGGAKGEQLNNQVAHFIPGASLNGLSASTRTVAPDSGGGGLLNPEHSRWLQGIPATWPSCAPMATRSIRSSRLK